MTCRRPGPSAATIPIANKSPGIASMMSIARMIVESTMPPRYPAVDPNTSPIDSPIDTETTPMSSEYLAP